MSDDTVTINKRQNDAFIVFIPNGVLIGLAIVHDVERTMDKAVLRYGLSRTGTDKDETGITLHYHQVAQALPVQGE